VQKGRAEDGIAAAGNFKQPLGHLFGQGSLVLLPAFPDSGSSVRKREKKKMKKEVKKGT
jgi:hypothetical protein